MKKSNIRIISIQKKKRRIRDRLLKQIIDENFLNLCKELDPRIQEANRTPNYLDPKRSSSRLIVLKLSKINDKERILKVAKEKKDMTYKGKPIGLSTNFSAETL